MRARVDRPIRFAVIGLGAGSLACRAAPSDTVHYYEIDPAVIGIARDPYLFSFLWACRPDVPIILGDARLTLAEAPDGAYDLIIVDAFSSDAIPIHLLTREAMVIYLKKLSPRGMVVMHVSNRHLELASVVAGIAAANGLITRVSDSSDLDEAANPYKFVATVAAVARSEEDLARSHRRGIGRSRRLIQVNGCGPTIIAISSARCSASSTNDGVRDRGRSQERAALRRVALMPEPDRSTTSRPT